MLTIIVRGEERWDEGAEEFQTHGDVTLELEHSLVSLSKWESKFEKPFLGAEEKSAEEVMAYIEIMIQTVDFPPEVLPKLSQQNMEAINDYINAKSSATWFREQNTRGSQEVITSELIYFWMISFNIPFECQHWHLNRLFTMIRLCSEKNKKPKKMSTGEMLAERRRLNAERRAAYKSSG